jgi:hypothetical protein
MDFGLAKVRPEASSDPCEGRAKDFLRKLVAARSQRWDSRLAGARSGP